MNFNTLDPLGSLSKWLVDGAVEAWKQTAHLALNMGNVTDAQWTTAFDVSNKIAGLMGFIAVGIGAIGIVQAMFKGSWGGVISALFRTILAYPINVVLITVTVRALAVEGAVTQKILQWAYPNNEFTIELKSDTLTNVNLAVAALIALLIIVGSLVLIMVMVARSFLIILGVSLAPIVTMSQGWDALRPALSKWGSWMVGIILFKPIAAIIIYITGSIIQNSQGDMMSYYTAIVGMFLASVLPWTLVKVVANFLPGAPGLSTVASAGQATVSTAVDTAKTVASVGVGVVTGGAGLASGAGSLLGASGKATGSAAQAANTADGATKKGLSSTPSPTSASSSPSATDSLTKDGKTSPSASSSPSTAQPSVASHTSDAVKDKTSVSSASSGLATGVGQFMQGASGVLASAAATGIAPTGASQAMDTAAKAANVIAHVSTSASSGEYTSGTAASPTNAINESTPTGPQAVQITTTPPASPAPVTASTPAAAPVVADSGSDKQVNVHVQVDSTGNASASKE
ncbi:hypothetical protein [Alloscardovia criceti]|uniref:hypothetical protein n=1 Tax=Alloscardovia criceti TaxID=356828 RepID=UPI00035D859D|nr:hypothetical protein [Alloscardovia criceti]